MSVLALVLAVLSVPGNLLFGVFAIALAVGSIARGRAKVLSTVAIIVATIGFALTMLGGASLVDSETFGSPTHPAPGDP